MSNDDEDNLSSMSTSPPPQVPSRMNRPKMLITTPMSAPAPSVSHNKASTPILSTPTGTFSIAGMRSPPPPPPPKNYNGSSAIAAKIAHATNRAAEIAHHAAIHMGSTQSLNNLNSLSLNSHVPGATQAFFRQESTNSSLDDLSDVQNLNPNGSSLNMSLLEGEQCVINDYLISYVLPDNRTLRGKMNITKFRLYFQSDEKQNSNYFIINLPLGNINRVEKIGHQSSKQQNNYGIVISCKDGRRLRFASTTENHSRRQIFESIQKHAFPASYKETFFAYNFKYHDNLNGFDGWSIYDAEAEYKRMGVLDSEEWRLTDLNKDNKFCDTYPKLLAVPRVTKDDDLRDIGEFRSKRRIPVLSWIGRGKGNQGAILRSSQPLCGIAGKRSKEDENYLSILHQINSESVSGKVAIMDARPQVNAMANKAKGGGYENEDNYEKCEVTFLNIQNIHVMRESLRKVFDLALPNADQKNFYVNLEDTKWLDHIKFILLGASKIVNKVYHGRSSVLVHCSDGWDRTPQLTSLAMLMLDKYYRTIRGFEILIEKEWLSFGHRFLLRMGHGIDKHSDQERSPVFLQFLDCVWQIQQHNKNLFEFNDKFLIAIAENLYSCQFGTFMYNSELERKNEDAKLRTVSLWTYLNRRENEFRNYSYSEYDGVITCPESSRTIRFWVDHYLQYKDPFVYYYINNSDRASSVSSYAGDTTNSAATLPNYQKNFFAQVFHSMRTNIMSVTQEPELIKYRSNLQPDIKVD